MKTVDHSYEQALIMHDNVHIHVIMNIIMTPTLIQILASSSHCLTPGEVPTVRAEAFAGLTLTQVFNHHLFAIKPDYDYHHSAYPDPGFQ